MSYLKLKPNNKEVRFQKTPIIFQTFPKTTNQFYFLMKGEYNKLLKINIENRTRLRRLIIDLKVN